MREPEIQIIRSPGRELSVEVRAEVEAILFEASGRTFEPGAERDAFCERWLGRYLRGGTDVVLLATDRLAGVAGYLVGALENPSLQDRFADISYYRTDFADLCQRFPAHLHINLAPAYRNRGIGARLIETFADHARAAGARSVHVVTGTGMRNVRFYERCGFVHCGTALWNGRQIVFLGMEL